MVQTLEQYVAQATQAYKPAQQAVDTQLSGLDSQLATTNQQIDRNYARQQAQLNQQRNMAAETASMQAAGSGGSFGGKANIANRKYYDQSFVPAVTQMQTNKSNDLATARQNYDTQKQNLQAQKLMYDAQANQQGLQQYWTDVENERNRQVQNAYNQFLMQQYRDEQEAKKNSYSLDSTKNEWGGYNWRDGFGNPVKIGQVANAWGGDFTDSLKSFLERAAKQDDAWSKYMLDEINNGYKFAYNTTGNKTGNDMYDSAGIMLVSKPSQTTQNTTTNNNATQQVANNNFNLGSFLLDPGYAFNAISNWAKGNK